ncbi:tigger transposable element-derived protein 4-like [Ornithodoros turicata]|uniref:tigger transposable element-derived protein 4-like n=1 Tax=Ornithodoros turicata TaxID=34597 RepID=UPI003139541A
MTQVLFEKWLRRMDRRFVREGRKVLFLVDNCPGHGIVSGLTAIRVEFLPPNTTARLQPMNQGVISSLKRHYRQSLLQRMLLCMENGKEYQVTLLSAIHLLSNAWEQVSKATIANSFRHAGFIQDGCSAAEEGSEELQEDTDLMSTLSSIGVPVDIAVYSSVDDDVATCREDTMDALIEEVLCTGAQTCDDEVENGCEDDELPPVTSNTADDAFSILVQYFQQHNDTEQFLANIG